MRISIGRGVIASGVAATVAAGVRRRAHRDGPAGESLNTGTALGVTVTCPDPGD